MLCQDTKRIILFGVAFAATRGLVGAISIAYMAYNGLALVDIGVIKGWQALVILVFDIPLSYLADRKSKKKTLLLAMLCCCIWMLVTSFSHTMTHFIIAEFFNALFLALSGGAFIAYLINSGGKEKNIKHILSKYSHWQFLALGISGFIGAAFIEVGNTNIWLLCSVAILLQLLFFSYYLPTEKVKEKRVDLINIFKFVELDKSKGKVLLFLNVVLVSIFYQSLIQFWQPSIVNNFNIDDGFVYSLIFLFILLAQSLAGYILSKDYNGNLVSLLTIVIIVLLNFLQYAFPIKLLYVFIINICCFIFINRLISLQISAFFHESIQDAYRATAEAVLATMTRIFLFILLPLIGVSLQLYGYKATLFLLLLTSSFVYFASLNILREENQKKT